jgi:hypothetical protein
LALGQVEEWDNAGLFVVGGVFGENLEEMVEVWNVVA